MTKQIQFIPVYRLGESLPFSRDHEMACVKANSRRLLCGKPADMRLVWRETLPHILETRLEEANAN